MNYVCVYVRMYVCVYIYTHTGTHTHKISSVKRDLQEHIYKCTNKKYCRPFTIFSQTSYASQSHINGTVSQNGVRAKSQEVGFRR